MKLIWFQCLRHRGYAFTAQHTEIGKKRKAETVEGEAKVAKTDASGPYDVYPDDDHLFDKDSEDEEEEEEVIFGSKGKRIGWNLYFSLKLTIPLIYLALLYTRGNVLLVDLVR